VSNASTTARAPAKGAALAGGRCLSEMAMNLGALAPLLLTTGSLLTMFVLLDLRLAGIVAWSWWWIFAPLWGPIVVMLPALRLWHSSSASGRNAQAAASHLTPRLQKSETGRSGSGNVVRVRHR
jgi:hypothetical protein